MDSIAQDIYYKKQTPSCAIFTATLLWNSAGHLLHKTNPDLSYFELSCVFWEHNDSVGRGTTVMGHVWNLNSIHRLSTGPGFHTYTNEGIGLPEKKRKLLIITWNEKWLKKIHDFELKQLFERMFWLLWKLALYWICTAG